MTDPRAIWLRRAIDCHEAVAAMPLPHDPDERAWRLGDIGRSAAAIAAVPLDVWDAMAALLSRPARARSGQSSSWATMREDLPDHIPASEVVG